MGNPRSDILSVNEKDRGERKGKGILRVGPKIGKTPLGTYGEIYKQPVLAERW